ncbi:ABC transporter ATP-binding protein [Oscillospiraceae bacterium MB08-C2-2]|nr:ABC transporter ATP-binding protein [Oscillospiraceae bacterium MB08-C2-2]
MSILRVENCSIAYAKGVPAVDGVSFSVEKGEIVSLVGESGSGKTTLLRAIMGILPSGGCITGGHIWFQETDIAIADESSLRTLRGKDITMIFQDPGRSLDPIQRIEAQYRELIRIHKPRCPSGLCREIAERMLRAMHLTDVERILHSYPMELSGGMKQRVGIAMAMTAQPQLLLADEPTSALDVTIQAQVVHEMRQLQENFATTMVLVTHNMGVASYLSDKIGVMHAGRLVEWGTRDQVIFHPKEAYTRSLLEAVPKMGGKRLAR